MVRFENMTILPIMLVLSLILVVYSFEIYCYQVYLIGL